MAEPNERGFVEDSWVRDQTQSGDVPCTKILARLTNRCVIKGERGSINHRAVNQAYASLVTQKANAVDQHVGTTSQGTPSHARKSRQQCQARK